VDSCRSIRIADRAAVSRGILALPSHSRYTAAVLGLVLLSGIPIVAITGLLSYVAYLPGSCSRRANVTWKAW
jgi:hypothetical protein